METYDSPLEAEHNLANQQDLFSWSEEDDEQKAAHHPEGVEENISGTKGSNKPAVQDSAENASYAGALA